MFPDSYSDLFDDANRNDASGANESDETVLGQTMETLERRNQELRLLHGFDAVNKTIETKTAMEVGLDLITKLTVPKKPSRLCSSMRKKDTLI